jgi:hypothetical protein
MARRAGLNSGGTDKAGEQLDTGRTPASGQLLGAFIRR